MNKTRSSISKLEYHLVWCTKYRRKILNKDISQSLKDILKEISSEYDFTISEMETDMDHIHLLIEFTPLHNIPHMVKIMKGRTSYILRRKHKYEINKKLWGKNLWSPSYFICTVSDNSRENVKNYIRNQ